MAKKKKHADHENLERWLISYADFITLLFALFVVLYAISEVDAAKLKKVANAFQFAFGVAGTEGVEKMPVMDFQSKDRHIALPVKGVETVSRLYYPEEAQGFEKIKKNLQEDFIGRGTEEKGPVPVVFDFSERGLVARFRVDYLFEPGTSRLKEGVLPLLTRMAKTLKEWDSTLAFEGHVDFKSGEGGESDGWRISAARSASLVRFFIDQAYPPHMISSGVYGDTHAVIPNDKEKGEEPGKRLDVVVLSKWERGNEP